MKRKFNVISKNNKKQRGVAVIFTLGILGLLTVMALGFASTALLNHSLSKNVMNNAYARSLAKSLALTQALYVINKEIRPDEFFDYRNIYSWGPDSDANSKNHKDFLWRLDYSDAGVQMFKYEPDKTASNPANNVRWQYVKDSNNKLIGRYAYVVIPDKGRIDPSVNIGKLSADASSETTTQASLSDLTPRVGVTPGKDGVTKSVAQQLTDDTKRIEDLKKIASLISAFSVPSAWKSSFGQFRWMTFQELLKKDSSISGNDKTYLFQYKGIGPSVAMKTPEAFRRNGKLYSRFNMNRTDWNTITAETLCGVDKTLKEFPDTQEFIPWLKDMYGKSEPLKAQALQIAANIIQYNRGKDQPTVSDGPADWTASTAESYPKYAGIGRHPMLNELGFLVSAKPGVEKAYVSGDETTVTYTYTPKVYLTFDCGAELIYPFGRASTQAWSTAIMKDSKVIFTGSIEVTMDKFLPETNLQTASTNGTLFSGGKIVQSVACGEGESLKTATIVVQLKNDTDTPAAFSCTNTATDDSTDAPTVAIYPGSDYAWYDTTAKSTFNVNLAKSDWNTSPVYTKSVVFWTRKQGTQKKRCLVVTLPSFTLQTSKSIGDSGCINKLLDNAIKISKIDIKPQFAVLKYDGIQRDFAVVPEPEQPGSAQTLETGKEKGWMWAYEAKDPLVNHNAADWTIKAPFVGEWNETPGPQFPIDDYPGTLYVSGGTEKHINKPVQDIIDSSESEHEKIRNLWSSFGWTSGKDPAAYNHSPAYRTPLGIVRHGQIRSFWDLACISRGEPWKPLNLAKKDNSANPDFSYDKGDAVLFDQLKFTDDNYSAGKININTDVHQVLEKIFNKSLIGYRTGLTSLVDHSDYFNTADYYNDEVGKLMRIGTIDDSKVKITAQTLNADGAIAHTESTCLACCLKKVTANYPFQNRGDLLLDYADLPDIDGGTKPSEDDWDTFQGLLRTGTTYLEKVQIAAKLMPLLRTAQVDSLRVVILAQSIRDVGGDIPVLVDWDGTGIETAVPSSEDANKKKAMWKAGYRRTIDGNKLVESESEGVWKEPVLTGTDAAGSKLLLKTYTKNAIGTYDLGRDKITGETKLVATLVRDPEKKKWKLVRLQYVE